jgi:pimeloyl-ACP methyl ester carboxylesterase
MIYQLQSGKTEAITRLMGGYSMNFPLSAMGLWIDCNEEFSFFNLAQATQANDGINLHLRDYFDTEAEGYFHACEPWKAPGVHVYENQPVESFIPTLLLSGEFDWSQPTAWAEKVAQTLRNSTVVEISGAGQVPTVFSASSVCSHQIVDAFLETPKTKPDISCASNPHKITWITLP